MKINLFWFDGHISKLERLTLKSIIYFNYTPVVWTYNKSIFKDIDSSIEVNDANDIILRENSFIYKGNGNTRPSYGCGFTDIFRAKLLHEIGGWYFDFDVTLLSSLDIFENSPFVFREHNIMSFVPNIIKAPKKSKFIEELYNSFRTELNEFNSDFFKPLKIFSNIINKQELLEFKTNEFGNDEVNSIIPFFVQDVSCNYKAIHWCNELFKNVGCDISSFKGSLLTLTRLKKHNLIKNKKIFFDWNNPVKDSLYFKLLKKYEV